MEDPRILGLALSLLAFALASAALQRRWVSMPSAMLILGLGLAVAFPQLSGTVQSEAVRTVAELTLALMLFHDAVRIDLRALRTGYEMPLRLLGIGMPVMIVFGALVAWGMMPAWGLVGAALLATMLAPTDAALGEAVVSDRRVPIGVRQGLNVESGLNDGLSVPVFLVLLDLAADPSSVSHFALAGEAGQQIGWGLVSGVVIGGLGGLLFKFASDRDLMETAWRRVAILALALACFVGAAVLGGSGFIGAFVGGVVFGLTAEARSAEDNAFTGYLGMTFDAIAFLLLGAAVLPFALRHLTWQTVVYAVISLVAIRMVSVTVALWRSGARWPTVLFAGWFGPRGLATLVFAILLFDANVPNGEAIASAAVIAVALSVLAHGFSAPPLVAAYARWWKTVPDGSAPLECAEAHEHRTRL